MKLLKREEFKEKVFDRDNNICVNCNDIAVDAHHIVERKLFEDGGYYLENGVSLCSKCHLLAEQTILSCDELRKLSGIKLVVLPEHFDKNYVYDKWGNIIQEDSSRIKGELFNSEQVQKVLPKEILNKFLMSDHYKYPRTPHLPWSEKLSDDDKMIESLNGFIGKNVIVTVKLDGENTTMYNDHIHARSLDSKHHPSRDWVKGLWGNLRFSIPDGWRICGENMYAKHTIPYNNLATYFYVFSIWTDNNVCLSWKDTVEWCELFGLKHVPVIYDGRFEVEKIKNLYQKEYNGDPCEGYVLRVAEEFKYEDFGKSMGKFVSSQFQIGDTHWMYDKIIPNQLKNE
jgi:hypothetical protein